MSDNSPERENSLFRDVMDKITDHRASFWAFKHLSGVLGTPKDYINTDFHNFLSLIEK